MLNPLLAGGGRWYLRFGWDETEIRGPVLILNDVLALSCALAGIRHTVLAFIFKRADLRERIFAAAASRESQRNVSRLVPLTLPAGTGRVIGHRKHWRCWNSGCAAAGGAATRIIAGAARDIHTSTLELPV